MTTLGGVGRFAPACLIRSTRACVPAGIIAFAITLYRRGRRARVRRSGVRVMRAIVTRAMMASFGASVLSVGIRRTASAWSSERTCDGDGDPPQEAQHGISRMHVRS